MWVCECVHACVCCDAQVCSAMPEGKNCLPPSARSFLFTNFLGSILYSNHLILHTWRDAKMDVTCLTLTPGLEPRWPPDLGLKLSSCPILAGPQDPQERLPGLSQGHHTPVAPRRADAPTPSPGGRMDAAELNSEKLAFIPRSSASEETLRILNSVTGQA